ncbi:MAG TPA: SAM-dependent chlorinase/fluorinase [Methylomirabilota bacterium]
MRRRRRPRPSGPSGVVTLLTDFGLDDAYVGTVKGVLLSINPRARLVDLTHAVPPQDIRRGALLLEAAWRFFPRGTVHLAIVDPGVGGARRPIAVAAGGHYFVGPDNGLLGFCFDLPGARGVVLADPRYHRRPVSRTFHGRDVFAPAAAHCSRGVRLGSFGPPLRRPVRLPEPASRRRGGRMEGEVLLADRFGNLLTSLEGRDLPGPVARGILRIGGARVRGLARTYAERPRHALGAVIDSSGRVEVFVRDGSARRRLGLGPGAPVSWTGPGSASTRGRPSTPGRSSPPHRSSRPSHPPRTTPARGSRPRRRSTSSRPPSPSSGPRRDSR